MSDCAPGPGLLGTRVFTQLQAERETEWLPQVFVPPPHFEAVAGPHSALVLGAGGAGKTALRLGLADAVRDEGGAPTCLLAHWRLALPMQEVGGSQLVLLCLDQVFDACAHALLRYLVLRPESFAQAPDWVQDGVVWFVRRYLQMGLPRFRSRFAAELTPPGVLLVDAIAERALPTVLPNNAAPTLVIAELVATVREIGLQGIWVMIDGLEAWVDADRTAVSALLRAAFSTLALFEDPGFAVKIVGPLELGPLIDDSGGVVTRRIDRYELDWPHEALTHLIRRRLGVALGRPDGDLAQIGDADLISDWLVRYGGNNPRAWLQIIGPLVEVHLQLAHPRPLTAEECITTYLLHPPRLRLDKQSGQVFVGFCEIADLQPASLKILRYLYDQRPRMCSRKELYYLAFRGLGSEPRSPQDPGWESPAWSGTLDTIIWRLRKSIEPFPGQPIYVVSARDKGVRLQNA